MSMGNGKFSKKDKNKQQFSGISRERRFILTEKSDFFLREAYKMLRTNVAFSLEDEDSCKVIVVTSALQSEGKSLSSLNLAIAFAQTDRRVLIIDCDLRRPKLARLLRSSAPAGLSNVLMHPDLLEVAIQHSEEYGIDAILSGDIPPNPSELLASNRMQRVLSLLRQRYDYIIVDTPPVEMVTDAVVLAPQSDGVLFVVRVGQSERGAVSHSMEQLEYARAKVLGFVLNNVDPETGGYGTYRYKRYKKYRRYGYHGGYRSGYGYSSGYGYGGSGYGYGYSSHRSSGQSGRSEAPRENR